MSSPLQAVHEIQKTVDNPAQVGAFLCWGQTAGNRLLFHAVELRLQANESIVVVSTFIRSDRAFSGRSPGCWLRALDVAL